MLTHFYILYLDGNFELYYFMCLLKKCYLFSFRSRHDDLRRRPTVYEFKFVQLDMPVVRAIYAPGFYYKELTNTSRVCNMVIIRSVNYLAWLQQFSYYIRLDHQYSNIKYMIADRRKNTFVSRTYQCAIHYIPSVLRKSNDVYQVNLDGDYLRDGPERLTCYHYYITLSGPGYLMSLKVRGGGGAHVPPL